MAYKDDESQLSPEACIFAETMYGVNSRQLFDAVLNGKNSMEIAQELGIPKETAQEAINILGDKQ